MNAGSATMDAPISLTPGSSPAGRRGRMSAFPFPEKSPG
jgi:hypothetical protein